MRTLGGGGVREGRGQGQREGGGRFQLTIQTLYPINIVSVQRVVGVVSLVVGRHEGAGNVGVAHPQGVAKLVGGDNLQVGASLRAHGPLLVIVKMRVTGDGGGAREEGVGQSTA